MLLVAAPPRFCGRTFRGGSAGPGRLYGGLLLPTTHAHTVRTRSRASAPNNSAAPPVTTPWRWPTPCKSPTNPMSEGTTAAPRSTPTTPGLRRASRPRSQGRHSAHHACTRQLHGRGEGQQRWRLGARRGLRGAVGLRPGHHRPRSDGVVGRAGLSCHPISRGAGRSRAAGFAGARAHRSFFH